MGGISVKMRYVRQTKSGFYWEPSRRVRALGFSSEPLGKDVVAALRRAKELNRQVREAIRGRGDSPAVAVEGTVSWARLQYEQSEGWKDLADSTKRSYRQALDRVEAWAGDERIEAITRKAAKAWYREMAEKAPAFAAATMRVLRILVHFMKDEGYEVADMHKLRLRGGAGEAEPWEDWEISAYLDEAKRQDRQSMALALMLGVCLGQREGDVLRLPRSAYDPAAGTIILRQQKTGRPLAVPVLPELVREIALTRARGTIFVVSEKSGKPYKARYFARIHREICRAAGISDKRWFMHLRHTAATRLGEAGCADDLIRSITGHLSRGVVARYVKPTDAMARAAISRLQDHRGRKET